MAWPWDKKPAMKPEPKKPVASKVETGSSLQQAKQVIKELNAELNSAKSENAKLKNNLANANKKVAEAQTNVATVQKQADLLKEWGVQKQKEAFEWLEKYTNAVKRYHRLKWIAAIIAGAFGVLFGLQLMSFVPPPYSLLVPIGGAGLFASLVWIFL
jgi:DNA repair exonuclease SbcCD ATPase subunit